MPPQWRSLTAPRSAIMRCSIPSSFYEAPTPSQPLPLRIRILRAPWITSRKARRVRQEESQPEQSHSSRGRRFGRLPVESIGHHKYGCRARRQRYELKSAVATRGSAWSAVMQSPLSRNRLCMSSAHRGLLPVCSRPTVLLTACAPIAPHRLESRNPS